jgi:hypothetical protein
MIYLVYEQELKLYGGILCNSLYMQKEVMLRRGSYEDLFILYFEFES